MCQVAQASAATVAETKTHLAAILRKRPEAPNE